MNTFFFDEMGLYVEILKKPDRALRYTDLVSAEYKGGISTFHSSQKIVEFANKTQRNSLPILSISCFFRVFLKKPVSWLLESICEQKRTQIGKDIRL